MSSLIGVITKHTGHYVGFEVMTCFGERFIKIISVLVCTQQIPKL